MGAAPPELTFLPKRGRGGCRNELWPGNHYHQEVFALVLNGLDAVLNDRYTFSDLILLATV